ncbi:hypothetical protein G6F56_002226 [Rhizopus delemar]|uniref:Uncharacterized protein n=1 Tax=Rhizopus stolonifer TaxID=4846 RepID=A0A367KQQ9_RHIST|nr:hypothetical protein G6F56_002226 [Rhizopus delemar]RCI04470.1 hypothetical protein CU098_012283 [Rhizopus stolonifer]
MENLLLSNRTYRLYAGHGNWINLGLDTTNELLDIFSKGVPTRYQLAPGLLIDIIPHDVDCNSKNIDMLGLMRADLVYESKEENTVQQSMSNYIHSLLDEQGIIDAFPPVKSNENLPVITSLPSHRHLSLVPSSTGIARRGPKPNHDYNYDSSSCSSKASQTKKKHSKRSYKKPKRTETKKLLSESIHLMPHSHYNGEPSSSMDFIQSRPWFQRPSELHFEFGSSSGPTAPTGEFERMPNLVLNNYELGKDRMYYSQPSPSSVTTSHPLLAYEPTFENSGEIPWVNGMKEEQWMTSVEYRKDAIQTDSTPSSFDLHRSSVDHGYYFDSSKSTTGPASPSDLDEILPESVKRVLL